MATCTKQGQINQLKWADISFCVTNDDDVFEKLHHYYTCIMLSQRKTYLYNVNSDNLYWILIYQTGINT